MATTAYHLLLWLHILAAAAVLGPLAAAPLLRGRRDDPPATRDALRTLRDQVVAIATPGIVLLFLTGMLMAVGPLAEWDVLTPRGYWILAGLGLWVVLAGLVGLAGGVLARLARRRGGGEPRGHGLAATAAVAALLAIEALMVFRPVIAP